MKHLRPYTNAIAVTGFKALTVFTWPYTAARYNEQNFGAIFLTHFLQLTFSRLSVTILYL